jgi:fructose-specific phosphotransferase system IIC component
MKALFVLLVLSTVAVLVAAIAMWWRLRRHLHQSDEVLNKVLQDMEPANEPEHESVEQR